MNHRNSRHQKSDEEIRNPESGSGNKAYSVGNSMNFLNLLQSLPQHCHYPSLDLQCHLIF